MNLKIHYSLQLDIFLERLREGFENVSVFYRQCGVQIQMLWIIRIESRFIVFSYR